MSDLAPCPESRAMAGGPCAGPGQTRAALGSVLTVLRPDEGRLREPRCPSANQSVWCSTPPRSVIISPSTDSLSVALSSSAGGYSGLSLSILAPSLLFIATYRPASRSTSTFFFSLSSLLFVSSVRPTTPRPRHGHHTSWPHAVSPAPIHANG